MANDNTNIAKKIRAINTVYQSVTLEAIEGSLTSLVYFENISHLSLSLNNLWIL